MPSVSSLIPLPGSVPIPATANVGCHWITAAPLEGEWALAGRRSLGELGGCRCWLLANQSLYGGAGKPLGQVLDSSCASAPGRVPQGERYTFPETTPLRGSFPCPLLLPSLSYSLWRKCSLNKAIAHEPLSQDLLLGT